MLKRTNLLVLGGLPDVDNGQNAEESRKHRRSREARVVVPDGTAFARRDVAIGIGLDRLNTRWDGDIDGLCWDCDVAICDAGNGDVLCRDEVSRRDR